MTGLNGANLTDEDLMQLYRRGESEAFDELYRRHSAQVYGYLHSRLKDRSLVDEVFQNIFLKLHRSRAKYDASLPFVPWLFTISRTVLIDSCRQRKTTEKINALYSSEQELNAPSRGSLLDEMALPESIPALASLSDSQKKVVDMRFREDLSFEEIAARLNTSSSNARQMVSRAIRKLKKWVEIGEGRDEK